MDTIQIQNIIRLALKCYKPNNKFVGVFPIDFINKISFSQPGRLRVCIFNSQTNSEPGEHWFVVGVDRRSSEEEEHAFVFDSLSQNLTTKYPILKKFLMKQNDIKFVLRNKSPVQNKNVDSCALHCIYFVLLLVSENYSFSKALGTFSSNALLNDCSLLQNFNDFLRCQESNELLSGLHNQLSMTYAHCK